MNLNKRFIYLVSSLLAQCLKLPWHTKNYIMKSLKNLLFSLPVLAMVAMGCNATRQQKGAVIGGAAGAVGGRIIGRAAGNRTLGTILGAVVGGAAGAIIGKKMDKQAKEIKQAVPDAQVERVGEGIEMTFNSALLFKINSSDLGDSAKANLDKLGDVFIKYPETNILVEGHTDDTGPDEYNMQLSERRAKSVSGYLESKGIPFDRFTIKWYGETQPKYPNDNDVDRSKNRRVELAIYANDKMKQEAQQGDLPQ